MELAYLPKKEYMLRALELAKEAFDHGEVPVGAVVVNSGRIIGEGRNRREKGQNSLYHAEIEAIDSACRNSGSWRLTGCELYVTLEPCPMCMGAVLNSRISRVVYGADDENTGCCGTAADLTKLSYYKSPEIYRGYMEEEAKKLLKDFFEDLR